MDNSLVLSGSSTSSRYDELNSLFSSPLHYNSSYENAYRSSSNSGHEKLCTSSSSSSQFQSSSSFPSSSSSVPDTIPVDNSEELSDYSDDGNINSLNSTNAWGILYPINPKLFRRFYMEHDYSYKVGRDLKCNYRIDKASDHFNQLPELNTFFLNISKVHFLVTKEDDDKSEVGFSVIIEDCSTNGTFLNGHLIGKGKQRPLLHCSRIALAGVENEAWIFVNVKEALNEYSGLPLEFQRKYVLEKIMLGSGATGVVRRAISKMSNERVAVKMITKGKSLAIVKNLWYESSLMRRLDHPNIVKVLDVFDTDRTMYMVLEYVEGGELFDFIKLHGRISENQSKVWFLDLLEAVSYLHGKNIIHRDLKPENILISSKSINSSTCTLKITDFGLSRLLCENSLMLTICGTLEYLAPEILDPRISGYTGAVDVWSLGCILFVMLSALPPFRRTPNTSLEHAVITGSYVFNPNPWTHISEIAKDLIRQMLVVSPDNRIDIDEACSHEWFTKTKKRKIDQCHE